MLKKLYKKNQFLLKPLKREWDTENFAVDDNTNSQFRLFSVTNRLKKIKSFQLFKN
jgi:hypothetical protein